MIDTITPEPRQDASFAVLTEIRDLIAAQSAELVSREGLAALLSISVRSVDQLASIPGAIPQAVSIPSLNRKLWRKRDVVAWIASGCKQIKTR